MAGARYPLPSSDFTSTQDQPITTSGRQEQCGLHSPEADLGSARYNVNTYTPGTSASQRRPPLSAANQHLTAQESSMRSLNDSIIYDSYVNDHQNWLDSITSSINRSTAPVHTADQIPLNESTYGNDGSLATGLNDIAAVPSAGPWSTVTPRRSVPTRRDLSNSFTMPGDGSLSAPPRADIGCNARSGHWQGLRSGAELFVPPADLYTNALHLEPTTDGFSWGDKDNLDFLTHTTLLSDGLLSAYNPSLGKPESTNPYIYQKSPVVSSNPMFKDDEHRYQYASNMTRYSLGPFSTTTPHQTQASPFRVQPETMTSDSLALPVLEDNDIDDLALDMSLPNINDSIFSLVGSAAAPARSSTRAGTVGLPGEQEMSEQNKLLVKLRGEGKSYKKIMEECNFDVAESTLRGRYRALTKPKQARPRKPDWPRQSLDALRTVVFTIIDKNSKHPKFAAAKRYLEGRSGSSTKEDLFGVLDNIRWKEVSNKLVGQFQCHGYGFAPAKKKYIELMGLTGLAAAKKNVEVEKRQQQQQLRQQHHTDQQYLDLDQEQA